jgi:ethanolamine ammonia-lyase small subunit
MSEKDIVADPSANPSANPWADLRRLTPARIGLGRAGTSLPTAAHLAFQLDHARARDAVHRPLDAARVAAELCALGLDVLRLHSAAADRATFLQRPDLGRSCDEASREKLAGLGQSAPDVAFAVIDGLSSLAIETNAAPFLAALLPLLAAAGVTVGPAALALQGRVALGDEIGAAFGARMIVVLIGERPGLSSPDSMGLYLTHAPRRGRSDAERNCISNIRPDGLAYDAAARKAFYLIGEALRRGLSGVALKDETGADGARIATRPD